jgi:hypothetical protein
LIQDPLAWRELAGRDHRGMADYRDEIALTPGFDPQNAKAVLGVVEGDAVDRPGQDFGWGACPPCVRHRVMMENKVLGRYRDQAGDDTWRARS